MAFGKFISGVGKGLSGVGKSAWEGIDAYAFGGLGPGGAPNLFKNPLGLVGTALSNPFAQGIASAGGTALTGNPLVGIGLATGMGAAGGALGEGNLEEEILPRTLQGFAMGGLGAGAASLLAAPTAPATTPGIGPAAFQGASPSASIQQSYQPNYEMAHTSGLTGGSHFAGASPSASIQQSAAPMVPPRTLPRAAGEQTMAPPVVSPGLFSGKNANLFKGLLGLNLLNTGLGMWGGLAEQRAYEDEFREREKRIRAAMRIDPNDPNYQAQVAAVEGPLESRLRAQGLYHSGVGLDQLAQARAAVNQGFVNQRLATEGGLASAALSRNTPRTTIGGVSGALGQGVSDLGMQFFLASLLSKAAT